MLFTPEPLNLEPKVQGDAKHMAENISNFFIERIELPGSRDVCAIFSDTKSKLNFV